MRSNSAPIGYSQSQRNEIGSIQFRSIIPAICTIVVVQIFRADIHRNLVVVACELLFFISLIGVFRYGLSRRWQNKESSKTNSLPTSSRVFVTQIAIVASVALTLLWQWTFRKLLGVGDATEIVALLALQYAAFCLAICAPNSAYEKLSLVLNAAIVFFVCCMTDRWDILVVGGVFAVIVLWWLLGLYWNRLDSKALDAHSQMLPVHGSAIGIATLIIAIIGGVACLLPLPESSYSGWGFSPFSGGANGRSDEFARSGIGDGDMLTGGLNATTAGAVDSDQFIEDDQPSLYDMLSESYEEPVFKARRNRAVAIDADKVKVFKKVKQSEIAGRTFRTMRKSPGTNQDLENRVTKALFFVEGAVPARFKIGAYHRFDGWDWETSPVDQLKPQPPKIIMKKQLNKPIFTLARMCPDFLTGRRFHRLKIMRLETASLPSPAFLSAWHIPQIDNVDFFDWNEYGQIEYDGESLPAQTSIDTESWVPNYHIMRRLGNLRNQLAPNPWWNFFGQPTSPSVADSTDNSDANSQSVYLQIPDDKTKRVLQQQVQQWTHGIEPGWNQVESIVDHIRHDFQLNPAWGVDQKAENTVGRFFDQQGGPSYMFATTCAMALRWAGYKTRLSNGFIVRAQDYDRVGRQSQVTSENIHLWPEVCLNGSHWIPVEPTPGYPIPYSTQTAWQWLSAQCVILLSWLTAHPITVLLCAGLATCVIIFRAELVSSGLLAWWHLVRITWPSGLLTTTRQLIDTRFWMAGHRRPEWETIRSWYTRIEPELSDVFFDLWNAQNFNDSWRPSERATVVAGCRETLQHLTLKKIRNKLPPTQRDIITHRITQSQTTLETK